MAERPAAQLTGEAEMLDRLLLEDPSLPSPDAVLFDWYEPPSTLEGLSGEELLEHALADPDVQAVMEAADGMQPVR